MANKPGIWLGTPCHSNVSVHYMQSVLNLARACWMNNMPFANFGMQGSLITHLRNQILSEYLQTDPIYTHFLFLDADIYIQHETVLKMLQFDKDVICTPYPKKTFNWDKAWKRVGQGRVKNADDLRRSGFEFPTKKDGFLSEMTPEGLIELTHAPTGTLLVKREVFHKMINQYPEREVKEFMQDQKTIKPYNYNFFDVYHDPKTKEYFSEDFGFCRLWTEIGGKCWAYVTEDVAHIGDFQYFGRMYDDFEFVGNKGTLPSDFNIGKYNKKV